MLEIVSKAIGAFVIVVVMIFVIACLCAFPIKWLWNDVIVSIFHLRSITAFEAWELLVLCGFLFKSSSASSSKSS